MDKFLLFFPVSNSLEIDRNYFDTFNSGVEILKYFVDNYEQLEFYLFNMNEHGYSTKYWESIDEFAVDYNDELFDGGWWCINFDLDKSEAMEIFAKKFENE